MENEYRKSVYRYGAEFGPFIGLYFIFMSACLISSIKLSLMTLLMAALLPGFPIILYVLMRRMYREAPYLRTFSALWTGGIMTTLCGCLICSLVTAAWLIFVQPDFFTQYLSQAIQTVQNAGQGSEYEEQINVLQKAMETGTMPSPMQFVLSMVWTTVFSGSIISMICAWVLMAKDRRTMSTIR